MQKVAKLIATTCLFGVLFGATATAQAAGLSEVLALVAAQDPNVAKVQQILTTKEAVTAGDSTEMKNLLTRALLQKAGVNTAVTNAASTFMQTPEVQNVVQSVVQQAVANQIGERLGPYQDSLSALEMLLGGTVLNPQSVKNNNALTGAPENYKRVLDMTATAYAPGTHDNGHWGNLNYVGGQVRKGIVAVDPSVIPMGTKLWVEGYGEAIANDQGSAIKGNRIDLAFNDVKTAEDYGIQKVKVYVLN